MSGVGSMVVLAAVGLFFDLPARLLPAADASPELHTQSESDDDY